MSRQSKQLSVPALAIVMLCSLLVLGANAQASTVMKWSSAKSIGNGSFGSEEFVDLSCTSNSFCVAGGRAVTTPGPVAGPVALVAVYKSGTWTETQVASNLNTGVWAIVKSVSCVSETFCVAGGMYKESGKTAKGSNYENYQPFISIFNGVTWTDSQIAKDLNSGIPVDNYYTGTYAEVDSISCVSSVFCIASGVYSAGHASNKFASVFNGSTWISTQVGRATASSSLGGAVIIPSYKATSISCVSITFCGLSGDYLDSQNRLQYSASIFNGATWINSQIPLPTNSGSGGISDGGTPSIHCTAPSLCIASGLYLDQEKGTVQPFRSLTNGASWSSIEVSDDSQLAFTGGSFVALYCYQSDLCVLIPTANSHGMCFQQANGVTPSRLCIAIGQTPSAIAENHSNFVSTITNSQQNWTSTNLQLNVGAVQCVSLTFCIAVGAVDNHGLGVPVSIFSPQIVVPTTTTTTLKKPVATTITCVKGKVTKRVTAIKPVCPAGYKKK